MLPLKSVLASLQPVAAVFARSNCYRAAFGSIKRPAFSRLYPVKLVKPDGSSITIKYHEPVAIIKMPFNLSDLDEAERKRRLMKRQMSNKATSTKQASGIIIDKAVKFDPKKYLRVKREAAS